MNDTESCAYRLYNLTKADAAWYEVVAENDFGRRVYRFRIEVNDELGTRVVTS